VQSKTEWNSLRKRLISAKMREAFASKTMKVKGKPYTIIKKIGDGGFSCVYQVYSEKRDLYALKVVNLLSADGHTDQKLKKEIELLSVLNH
jgi:serine/threonine protein kinase